VDDCGYCESILYAHCVELHHGQAACEIRERYYSDPEYTSDQALEDLAKVLTPQQQREGIQRVMARRLAHEPPVPRPPETVPAQVAGGAAAQAAAMRWLSGWQGRNS